MSLIEILFLALALSIDACVASFAYGLCFKDKRLKNSMLLAVFCGGFQGLMPIFGYFLLNAFIEYVEPFSKILVFIIFLLLGLNFIKDGIKNKKEVIDCLNLKSLLIVALATSIDAFAAGASIALHKISVFYPALIIAVITFINSLLGFWSGNLLKNLPTRFLKFFAGFILIFLAIKSYF